MIKVNSNKRFSGKFEIMAFPVGISMLALLSLCTPIYAGSQSLLDPYANIQPPASQPDARPLGDRTSKKQPRSSDRLKSAKAPQNRAPGRLSSTTNSASANPGFLSGVKEIQHGYVTTFKAAGHGIINGSKSAGATLAAGGGKVKDGLSAAGHKIIPGPKALVAKTPDTSHPLKRVANRLRWLTTHTLADLKECSDGTTVIVGGLIATCEKKLTKQNKLIGIFRLEDLLGQMEAVAYGELLESLPADILTPQSLVLVKGKVKKSEEDISILASSIRHLADASIVSIYFNKEQSFTELQQLKEILTNWRGDDPVLLNFPAGKANQTIIVGNQFWVKASDDLKLAMNNILADKAKVLLNKVRV